MCGDSFTNQTVNDNEKKQKEKNQDWQNKK